MDDTLNLIGYGQPQMPPQLLGGSGFPMQDFGFRLMAASGPSRLPVPLFSSIGQAGAGALQDQRAAYLPQMQGMLLGQEARRNELQNDLLSRRIALANNFLLGNQPTPNNAPIYSNLSPEDASAIALSHGGGPTVQNGATMNSLLGNPGAAAGAPPSGVAGTNTVLGNPSAGGGNGAPMASAGDTTMPSYFDARRMFQYGQASLALGDPTGAQLMKLAVDNDPSIIGARSAAEARGSAPYKALESLLSRAGTPVRLEPGDNVTTGFSNLPPQIQSAVAGIVNGIGGTGSGAGTYSAGGAGGAMPRGGNVPGGGTGANSTGFPTQSIHGQEGTLQSPLTLEGAELQKQILPERYKKAADSYDSAQTLQGQLNLMDNAIEQLNQAGWSSTGEGANARLGAVKTINGVLSAFGVSGFDPTKIASWESFQKESTRAGFELAKTLGSREAQMIVQQAISAVPNAENTYLGARLVSSSLRQAAQRQMDYYEYLTDFAQQHGGSTWGADIAFNKSHPTQGYTDAAIVNAIPQNARIDLARSPGTAAQFDAVFGKGMAKRVLNAGAQ